MSKEPGYWAILYFTGLPAKEDTQATPYWSTEVLSVLVTTRCVAFFLSPASENVQHKRLPLAKHAC